MLSDNNDNKQQKWHFFQESLISLGQEKRGDLNLLMLNLSAGEMMGVVVGQISIEVILHISVRLLHL
jgi:hypothetical protein